MKGTRKFLVIALVAAACTGSASPPTKASSSPTATQRIDPETMSVSLGWQRFDSYSGGLVESYKDPGVSAKEWIEDSDRYIPILEDLLEEMESLVTSVEGNQNQTDAKRYLLGARAKLAAFRELRIALVRGDLHAERTALKDLSDAMQLHFEFWVEYSARQGVNVDFAAGLRPDSLKLAHGIA